MSHDKSTRSAWPACLALICFALVQLSAALQSDEPWYCHSLDCPSFTTLKWSDGLELRSYQDSLWVSTNVSGVSYDTAVRYGFLRLFEYISGANEHGWRIEMTAPVRTRLIAGEGPFCEDTFTVSFYLPDEYQSGGKKPPAPNRDSLFIDSTPGIKYWVYSYPGFTSQDKIISMVSDVIGKLEKLGEKFSATTYYAAGYDPPFRIINRHNEVWLPVEPENSASQVSKVQGKGMKMTNRKVEIKEAAA